MRKISPQYNIISTLIEKSNRKPKNMIWRIDQKYLLRDTLESNNALLIYRGRAGGEN
jgi:hypothetical protein